MPSYGTGRKRSVEVIRNRASETLHARIKKRLLDNIVGGTWKPGAQVPIETELAASFGVSRMTMNKVLTQLSNEGYITRHKKRGTFVARPRSQSAVMEIASIREEVAALGERHRWSLLERAVRPLGPEERALLNPMVDAAADRLVVVRGVHFSGEVPFCHETRAINPRACPAALEQDFETVEPGQWLLDTVPWITAQHTIRAINASRAEARVLALDDGQACLEILRQTRTSADWVTTARLLYSGEAHQLVAQFGPGGRGNAP
ncbi:UTRA domain-containing protein [Oceaniglobus roseus]|uniref:UTRA domain-containing protein n=1 Tax=Oceaniglobus roseus TaxID=1737570 RepID=UPI001561E3B1|nr:UTRA domain-containing protein [Kandeliimicrobium roseum]